MRYIIILMLLLCLAQLSCDHDLALTKKELSIAEAKLLLATAKDENDLITRIDKTDNLYSFSFESGNSASIKATLLTSIVLDSTNWLATFTFHDNSVQTASFLSNQFSEEITLNPYLTAPLTALVTIETPVKGKFKIVVKEKPGGVSLEKVFAHFGESHVLPILGLYEDFDNQLELIFMNQENQYRCSKTVTIHVPANTNKPDLGIKILKTLQSKDNNGYYMVFSHRVGFDQTGEVRWYYTGEGANFYTKLKNGNFISSSSNNLSFYEVTMLGQTVKKYDVPHGLHHEIIELPSGNFLVASHSPPGPPLEDVVVEISRSTGQVVKAWDFNFILDPLRKALPDIWEGDWLHINAMYFDNADNSIVVSARSQSAVIKLDYETGKVKWILGNHNFWNESLQPFLLKPVDSHGDEINVSDADFWIYGQHAIQKTTSGTILMYDNGDYRGFYDNPNAPQASYTRLVEYKINEQTKTVQKVWQFDHDKSVFTLYTGYAQDLPSTNTRLVAYMWVSENTPKIMELDENSQTVFEATLKPSNSVYYRTYKVNVYGGID